MQRMSFQDASFLHIESDNVPGLAITRSRG